MIRNSLNYVGWKERKAVATDLKTVYRAETADTAALRLDEFEEKWGRPIPAYRPIMATKLGACDPLLCLPRGGQKDHLHHQRH